MNHDWEEYCFDCGEYYTNLTGCNCVNNEVTLEEIQEVIDKLS